MSLDPQSGHCCSDLGCRSRLSAIIVSITWKPEAAQFWKQSKGTAYFADKLFVTATLAPVDAKQLALQSLTALPPFCPELRWMLANPMRGQNRALTLAMTRLWEQVRTPRVWSMTGFAQHSVGTAILADLICQETTVDYGQGAYLGGLLHDVGKLLLALAVPDTYEYVERFGVCERAVLGWTHAELSAEALRIWNVPERIQTAVCQHHEPELDPTPVAPGQLPLSYAISAAERYLHSVGNERFERFGMDARIPRLLKTFEAEFDSVRVLL